MEIKEREIMYALAKALSEKGEIVKINDTGLRRIISGKKKLVPDLVTIDKDNKIVSIYEIMLKIDEKKLIDYKEIMQNVDFIVVSSAGQEKILDELIKKNKLKIKGFISFEEKK